jgi:hypothetical protein
MGAAVATKRATCLTAAAPKGFDIITEKPMGKLVLWVLAGFGAFVLIVIALLAMGGSPTNVPVVGAFSLNVDRGLFSHDLLITNDNPTLSSVEVSVSMRLEDGTMRKEDRFWTLWQAGMLKTINVPAANIQTVELKGTGTIENGGHVRLRQSWRF